MLLKDTYLRGIPNIRRTDSSDLLLGERYECHYLVSFSILNETFGATTGPRPSEAPPETTSMTVDHVYLSPASVLISSQLPNSENKVNAIRGSARRNEQQYIFLETPNQAGR